MSLLWPSTRVAIAPGHVAVAAGGRIVESDVVEPGWSGALKTLGEQLSGARSRARVVLSHHFAPVYLLPAAPVRLSHGELQGWARERLMTQFGEPARNWHLAVHAEPPGDPFLVSTLLPERLSELQGTLAAAGVRAISLQPWLAVACNRHRVALGRGDGWLALAEPGRLTLARLRGGRFRSLRSAQSGTDPARDLADMLAREALLEADGEKAPVWLAATHAKASWQNLGNTIQLRPLGSMGPGMAAMLGT